jgi:hypothetical protein
MAEETCPFCGVSVVPATLEGVNPLFAPPYAMGAAVSSRVPPSPYESEDASSYSAENAAAKSDEENAGPAVDNFKRTVISIALLLTGSVFFMFALALAFFSHNGVLTLQWESAYWYVYGLVAIPMVFFGWRALGKVD